jgi:chromate transporter
MTREPPSLARFLTVALALGLLGFGGGWVVVGWIRRVVVEERGWMGEDEFVEHAAVASALTGITGTNLVTVVGYRLGGVGWAVAGPMVFILPSAVLVTVIAASYDWIRSLHLVMQLFDGMAASVAGVVLSVAIGMRKKALESALSMLVALGALVLLVTHAVGLLEVVLAAGVIGVIAMRGQTTDRLILALGPVATFSIGTVSSLTILWVFSRIGVATFGGGYAMVPAMEHEILGRGWLDEKTFTDAITIGQITPGPVALSGTFLGYRLGGVMGAAAATAGMFVPPLVIAILVARSIARFRASPWMHGFLSGIAAAVVGVIAAASWSIGKSAIHTVASLVIAVASTVVMVARPKASPVVVLFCGALVHLVWIRLIGYGA